MLKEKNNKQKTKLINSRWRTIPEEYFSAVLTPKARDLYMILIIDCNQFGFIETRREILAKKIGINKRRIGPYFEELENKKLIKIIRGGDGKPSVYIVNNVDFKFRLRKFNRPLYRRYLNSLPSANFSCLKNISDGAQMSLLKSEGKISEGTSGPTDGAPMSLLKSPLLNILNYDYTNHTHNPKYLREIKSPNTEPLPFVCEGGVEGNLAQNLSENDKCIKNITQKKLQVIDLQGKSAANTSDNKDYRPTNSELSAVKSVNEEINKYFIIIKNIYSENIYSQKMFGDVKKANSIFIREAQKQKDLKKYVDEIVAGIAEQQRLLEIRERTGKFTATNFPYLAKYLSEKTWLRYQPVKKSVKKKYPEPEFTVYRRDGAHYYADESSAHTETCECEICTISKNLI